MVGTAFREGVPEEGTFRLRSEGEKSSLGRGNMFMDPVSEDSLVDVTAWKHVWQGWGAGSEGMPRAKGDQRRTEARPSQGLGGCVEDMVSPETCGKPLRVLKQVEDGNGGGQYNHIHVWKDDSSFMMESR